MNDDLISRQAAIKAIVGVFPVDPMRSEFAQGISCGAALAKTYVEQMPSAQPEIAPKTGRWINIKPLLTAVRCSECKRAFAEKTNFCPHCGAKMKGETE